MVATDKKSYKSTNWKKCNESLVQRGSITFWFSDDVIDQWEHANEESTVGRPFVYSPRLLGSLGPSKACSSCVNCFDFPIVRRKVWVAR